jgi:hypothetical protein
LEAGGKLKHCRVPWENYVAILIRVNMKKYISFAILFIVIFQQAANATCEKSDAAKSAEEIFTNHRDFFSVDPVAIKSLLAPALFAVLADEYSWRTLCD